MVRRAAQLAAVVTAIAACNALTGVGDLAEAVGDGSDGGPSTTPTAQPTATTTVPTSTATVPPPPPPPPSDAGPDADASVPPPDTGAPDTYVPPPPPCIAGSSGPRYGTVANATDIVVGGERWTSVNGARAPNDNMAAHSNNTNANTLSVSTYAFGIPDNATIKGIEVQLHRTANGTVSDNAITLLKGNPKTNGAWPAGPENGPFIAGKYGGSTDLWGTSWVPADINATGFVVNVKVNGNGDGHLDAVGVTVFYCAPAP